MFFLHVEFSLLVAVSAAQRKVEWVRAVDGSTLQLDEVPAMQRLFLVDRSCLRWS